MYFDVVGLGNPFRQKFISEMIYEKNKRIYLTLTHEHCMGDEEGWYQNDIAIRNSNDDVIGFLSAQDSQIVAPILAQDPDLKVKMSNIEEDDRGFFDYQVQLAYAKSINMSFFCLRLKGETSYQAAIRHLQYYAKDTELSSLSLEAFDIQKKTSDEKALTITSETFDNLQKQEDDRKFSNFFIGAALIFIFLIVIEMLN